MANAKVLRELSAGHVIEAYGPMTPTGHEQIVLDERTTKDGVQWREARVSSQGIRLVRTVPTGEASAENAIVMVPMDVLWALAETHDPRLKI